MTISTTESRISYSGNGITTAFTFPYPFTAQADLVVILVDADGTETTQTLTTHYTVAGAGGASGTVTMLTAPSATQTLVIYRELDITQETDYITGDAFPAETHEAALDKLTQIAQQINTRVSRTVRLSEGDTGTDVILPVPQADYYLKWNSLGTALTQVPAPSGLADAASVTYTPAGSGAVATTVQSKLRDFVSIADFGADPANSAADNVTALQAAEAVSDYIFIPEGDYSITEAYATALDGEGVLPTTQFFGPGNLLFSESGYQDQQLGSFIFAGSHKSRGGEQRANRKGGLFLGSRSDPRGVQYDIEECSSWNMVRERSTIGQSLLWTLMPNCQTVNGTITFATDADQIVASVGTFQAKFDGTNNSNWPVDAVVHFDGQQYRIGSVDSSTTMTLVADDGTNSTDRSVVTYTADATDNCILPAHFWEFTADITTNAVNVTSGDYYYDDSGDDCMIFTGGSWYRVSASNSGTQTYTITDIDDSAVDLGTLTDQTVLFMWQPTYSNQFTMKRTAGAGLEETFKIKSDADAYRISSTGSNVAQHKPIIFEAGVTGNIDTTLYDAFGIHGRGFTGYKGVNYPPEVQLCVDSTSYNIPKTIRHWINRATGTKDLVTLSLANNPLDGQVVTISTAGALTNLTIDSQGLDTVEGSVTALATDESVSYIYSLAQTTWYRCGKG